MKICILNNFSQSLRFTCNFGKLNYYRLVFEYVTISFIERSLRLLDVLQGDKCLTLHSPLLHESNVVPGEEQ